MRPTGERSPHSSAPRRPCVPCDALPCTCAPSHAHTGGHPHRHRTVPLRDSDSQWEGRGEGRDLSRCSGVAQCASPRVVGHLTVAGERPAVGQRSTTSSAMPQKCVMNHRFPGTVSGLHASWAPLAAPRTPLHRPCAPPDRLASSWGCRGAHRSHFAVVQWRLWEASRTIPHCPVHEFCTELCTPHSYRHKPPTQSREEG